MGACRERSEGEEGRFCRRGRGGNSSLLIYTLTAALQESRQRGVKIRGIDIRKRGE